MSDIGNMPEPTALDLNREAARCETIRDLDLLDAAADVTFDRIVRVARAISGCAAAGFAVLDGEDVFYKAQDGIGIERVPRLDSLCARTIEQGQAMTVPDLLRDPRFLDNPFALQDRLRFYFGLPVRAPNGQIVGSLCVMDAAPRNLDPAQVARIEDLRDLLEETLVLRTLSLIDPLTGLFNRRHLDRVLSAEWRRAYRFLLPLTVLVVDVDHFKAYNDRYGHLRGDDCLRAVASLLRNRVQRAGDLIARYGGEEFVLVLPQTPLAGAQLVAERVLESVRESGIEHAGAPCGHLTMSVGGAVAAEDVDMNFGEQALLAAADAALYEAKNSGRNAIRVRQLSREREPRVPQPA